MCKSVMERMPSNMHIELFLIMLNEIMQKGWSMTIFCQYDRLFLIVRYHMETVYESIQLVFCFREKRYNTTAKNPTYVWYTI